MSTKKKRESSVEVKSVLMDEWLEKLYDINLFNSDELKDIYDTYKYHGFDRESTLLALKQVVSDPKVAIELVILCALNGPTRASQTKLRGSNQTPASMGIPASGLKGKQGISCARITAATADLAAYYLKEMKVPKRLLSSELPAWLQFPSAGSIRLPKFYREQHIEFSKRFSEIIKGTFDESIYSQMMANEYLDPRLNLFN
jgi:hypothetical protein